MEGSRVDNLEDNKNKIISLLKLRGPSIPIRISNYLGIDSLLTNAFLSELVSEKRIKLSKMRMGNSPVYYLPGQETQLESFAKYLKDKEREAFELLKNKGILIDKNQQPAIRVALRNLKDFAFPVQIQNVLLWRYLTMPEHRIMEVIQSGRLQLPSPILPTTPAPSTTFLIAPKESIAEEKIREKPKEKLTFSENIEEFLRNNNFQIVRNISSKKRDYSSIVRLRDEKGFKDYLCIGKDKKSVTGSDVMKLLEAGKKDKFPVLIITKGTANKKAQEWIDYLRDFITFRKLD